jgi:hypothetical protein
MLVVVALVVALTLLEKRPLVLDFICTDLESCTDEIFKTPLVATLTFLSTFNTKPLKRFCIKWRG